MADVTVKKLDEMEAIFGGGMVRARASLGASAFGMQVISLAPGGGNYPEHDHSADGQEEIYTPLEGTATLTADGEEHTLEPGTFARVGPGQKRKLASEQGARMLCIGGVPGGVYEAPGYSELGAPEPQAS